MGEALERAGLAGTTTLPPRAFFVGGGGDMIRPGTDLTVYLCREPVDMRKQNDGLALLVQEAMDLNPFDQALFVFGNRQRDKVKLLFRERNGFVVWYKRLERERFKWPAHLEGDTVTLTGQELNWLLDGVDLKAMQPHKAPYFQQVG
ncbi:IS66 family insertion sequence element accessory protein TnpB [Kushneria aurantia]|uniref:IS66 family insertion sequence element accessory protein TnpB n=1 Tax=Kushneria aurantia TaxID=504092 RepID=A0ABV6FYC9_9GAMM|nr:IS66 family insertion sequence element accessory protein TnpB [Kushneria aurantia]